MKKYNAQQGLVKVISALRKTEKQDYSKSAIYDVYYVK